MFPRLFSLHSTELGLLDSWGIWGTWTKVGDEVAIILIIMLMQRLWLGAVPSTTANRMETNKRQHNCSALDATLYTTTLALPLQRDVAV